MIISRNLAFLGSDTPKMLFFVLMNVEMPTIVEMSTIISRKIYNLGVWLKFEGFKVCFYSRGDFIFYIVSNIKEQ